MTTIEMADGSITPDERDRLRRRRLRGMLLTATGIGALALGLALATLPDARVAAVFAVMGGVVLLIVRLVIARVPDWLSLTVLTAVIVGLLFAGPLATGNLAGRAFLVGVLTLVVLATAPRPPIAVAVIVPIVALVMLWRLTRPVAMPMGVGEEVTWTLIVVEAALVAAGTLVALTMLLSLVDASAADRDSERERVEQLASDVLLRNEQLELEVAERTAHLEAAVRERDQLAADLREASTVDPGSGLPNQRRWEMQLPVMLAQARERSMLVCVAVIDLDEFSSINHELGHVAGDEVIRRVAQRLHAGAGPETLVSRIGGEEFGLAFVGIDQRLAVGRCQLLQAAVSAEPWNEVGSNLAPTFSAGVVEVSPDAVGDVSSVAREALLRADSAMQRAKREGRNRILSAEPL